MDDWNMFLETPPSLGQSFTPPLDIEFNSPLHVNSMSNITLDSNKITNSYHDDDNEYKLEKDKTGLINPNVEEKPVIFDNSEIECRVLQIQNLDDLFEFDDTVRLFSNNAKTILSHFEKKSERNFIFEFFDLRHSLFYRTYLEGSYFDDQPIEVRYGSPRRKNEKNRPANNGTIVLFHLPPAVSNPQLSDIFGKYGEIRQIRGTPSKPKQRFIEYWDTRSSDIALREMNGKLVLSSKISIEFSMPGGMRRHALE
ncbi:hypothetical protein TRFO_32265 [Tritrichomonas foetus]|uniref:RRM domain-containing protein n=1 Tax=Tritrichomonas foetus TaxID=1144522 RepID=A0A1J4JP44_9EUKA|nr:hypothetical protein TRFO_32265 [Tritrichomonas foetus]|eukprot:OHT00919.1 hypothetical protein TRFO_32265 [Tritrichomonas foetus]